MPLVPMHVPGPECRWVWLRHAVYQCTGCNLYHDVRLQVFTTDEPPVYQP